MWEHKLEQVTQATLDIPSMQIRQGDLVGFVNLYKYASPLVLQNEEKVFGNIIYIPDYSYFKEIVRFWFDNQYQSHIESVIKKLEGNNEV